MPQQSPDPRFFRAPFQAPPERREIRPELGVLVCLSVLVPVILSLVNVIRMALRH